MSVSQISVDILKDYVVKAIEKWQKNDLLAEARLAADDLILDCVDDIPDPKDKDHPYNRFLYAVASDMVSVFGEGEKTFFRQLCRYSKQWQELISPQIDKLSTTKKLTKTKAPKLEGNEAKEKTKRQPTQGMQDIVEDGVDATIGENNNDGEPPLTLDEKRKLFEEGKEAILAEVPNDAKARFGEIYFAKWGKQFLPVLVMNPYSIPPGAARKLWVDMFDNLKKSDRLANMTNLVYWYGSSRDTDNCYSIWVTKNLMPYDAAIKKKVDQIPAALQKKIDQGKKPTGVEAQFIDALKEMKEDLAKEPHERRGYLPQDFREVWELSSDDEGNAVFGEKPIATKKGDPVKPKEVVPKAETTSTQKRKKDTERVGQASEPLRKKTKPAKKPKSNQQTVVSEFSSPTTNEKEDEASGKPPTVISQERSVDADLVVEAADLEAPAQRNTVDAVIKAEQDEYDYGYAMGTIESEEESDEDFGDTNDSHHQLKRKTNRSSSGDKVLPKKQGQKVKHKQKIAKAGKKRSSEKDEQRNFARSEEEFHPVFVGWQKALVAQDREAIMRHMQDVQGRVERIHLSLMPSINELLRATKKVLSVDQKDTLKVLRSTLKTQYDLKKDGCLSGFVPKRKYAEVYLEDTIDTPVENESQGSLLSSTDAPKPVDSSVTHVSVEIPRQRQPSSPLRRSGSLEKVVDKPESSTEGTQQQKDVKNERKKFSLGNLMRPMSDDTKTKCPTSDNASSTVPDTKKHPASLPNWVTGKVLLDVPTDDRRSFGFEFLRQAVPFIQGKGVDHNSMACALEASIDAWSEGDTDKYWKKIDDIVVALSGDKRIGTLSIMIAKGEFKEPADVVGLSDASIYDSFVGKPLVL